MAVSFMIVLGPRVRRYSEGQRWIDLRRHSQLATLPLDLPEHRRFDKFPFPEFDCDAYPQPPQGCSPVAGY